MSQNFKHFLNKPKLKSFTKIQRNKTRQLQQRLQRRRQGQRRQRLAERV